jgi:transglutaminase-like putative cysteine protease
VYVRVDVDNVVTRISPGPSRSHDYCDQGYDIDAVPRSRHTEVVITVRIDASLSADVQKPGQLALCLAAASPGQETLHVVDADGAEVAVREVEAGTARVHLIDAPQGELHVSYRAEAALAPGHGEAVDEVEGLVYRRPSRYCPSDRLAGLATAQFGALDPREAVFAIEQWLHDTVAYVPGVTDAVDDALHPLLDRTGVCRDFAHLGVAMCRGLGIPARYTAVYAPGLDPMDFHAVFEAAIDGRWWVFDGTRLAPRASLVRIASGRDAADTALLTPLGVVTGSLSHELTVTTVGDLPQDDRRDLQPLT